MSPKGKYTVNGKCAEEAPAEDAQEFVGIEPIPSCSLKNLTVIMTKSIENAFYRYGSMASFIRDNIHLIADATGLHIESTRTRKGVLITGLNESVVRLITWTL